jgi:hypothetical protein
MSVAVRHTDALETIAGRLLAEIKQNLDRLHIAAQAPGSYRHIRSLDVMVKSASSGSYP